MWSVVNGDERNNDAPDVAATGSDTDRDDEDDNDAGRKILLVFFSRFDGEDAVVQ